MNFIVILGMLVVISMVFALYNIAKKIQDKDVERKN